jgi:glycosyltransferase involved in cell wall biosynthesis
MIHHCISTLSAGGGMQTYVKSLLQHHPPNVSDRVLFSIEDVDQSQFDLLHVHDQEQLWAVRGECPVVFTLHNHSTYCPSGTKYLEMSHKCCNRQMSSIGCIWGHLVDGCGSRRPQKIVENLQNSYQELSLIQQLKIPVIAISQYSRQQLIQHGLPPEQVTLLRHGIEIPQSASSPLTLEIHQAQRILFVGRIVPHKGLDWLIKALAQLEPSIQLDIAGEGWDQSRIIQLAKQLGVSDRITWHGWCNSEKLDQLYQQCFAVTFPSVWPEPAGLVTLEAYARHRPVIASHLGGIPEYVRPGETGILVKANDSKQLAIAINELATNYPKSRNMGEQGHEWFLKEFTIENHISQLQYIYEKVVDK